MYLYKTATFPHQPLMSISKVALLHRFYCIWNLLTRHKYKILNGMPWRIEMFWNIGKHTREMHNVKFMISHTICTFLVSLVNIRSFTYLMSLVNILSFTYLMSLVIILSFTYLMSLVNILSFKYFMSLVNILSFTYLVNLVNILSFNFLWVW